MNDDDNRSVMVKLQLEDNDSNGDSEAEERRYESDIQEEGTSSSDDEKGIKDKLSTSVPPVLRFNDIGKLEFDHRLELPVISQQLRTELVTRGSASLQNKDGPFANDNNRGLSDDLATDKVVR